MTRVSLILWVLFLLLHGQDCSICQKQVCEYNFKISHARTMTYRDGRKVYNVGLNGTRLEVIENSYRPRGKNDLLGQVVDRDDVITADGFRRSVIVINGQFPGPAIEVVEGAEVVVRVTNALLSDAITVHWHGLPMRDTPWMDGNPYVTQCPILPRQSFTYRFTATPVGTHWYHSHVAGLQADGLYGFLVVHPAPPSSPSLGFNVAIQEWIHVESSVLVLTNPYGTPTGYRGSGEDVYAGYDVRGYSTDGVEIGALDFKSALINGRGRWKGQAFPLTEFNVQSGSTYRFRLLNSGSVFAFQVSLDGHAMKVVALDGHDVVAVTVDDVVVSPGERVDVEVTCDRPADRYWLRAVTLRDPRDPRGEEGGRAVVVYTGSPSSTAGDDPVTTPRSCTKSNPCRVLNCPFTLFPEELNTDCVGLESMRSPKGKIDEWDSENDLVELFFNVGFNYGSSINGRRFIGPSAPMYQADRNVIPCEEKCKDPTKGCMCTHITSIPYNKTIQMVISNLNFNHPLLAHHRMHLHGHTFAVVKVGYPEFNATTGHYGKANDDVTCSPGACTTPGWRNDRPVLRLENPPLKDTITIPARGYVVVRFRSDNPGWWMFHCHAITHKIEGMDMIIEEAPGHYAPPPPTFPACPSSWPGPGVEGRGTGRVTAEGPYRRLNFLGTQEGSSFSAPAEKNKDDHVVVSRSTFIGALIGCVCLGALVAVLSLFVYIRYGRSRRTQGGLQWIQ